MRFMLGDEPAPPTSAVFMLSMKGDLRMALVAIEGRGTLLEITQAGRSKAFRLDRRWRQVHRCWRERKGC